MKNYLLKSSLLLLTSVFVVSCSDDEPIATSPSSFIVGFPKSTTTELLTTDLTDANLAVPVNILTRLDEQLLSEDLVINWEIIANDNDLTDDAQAGVEYDLPNGTTSGTVTIPAGNTAAFLNFNLHPNALDPDSPKNFTLKLTNVSNSRVVIGEQYRIINVVLQGVCVSSLDGEYYITYSSGNKDITIEQVATGLYRASYFPTFANTYWWEFSDVCGVLTITDWQYQGGNPIYGTSSPMPTGTINPDGSLTFSGVNVTGVSWYIDRTWTIYPY